MVDNNLNDEIGQLNKVMKQLFILDYASIHLLLEDRLRDKLKNKEKLRVAFVISDPSQFEAKSVYDEMTIRNDVFEPFLFVVSRSDKRFAEGNWNAVVNHYKKRVEQGYKTIFGYDDNRHFLGIEFTKPDIVFHDFPKLYTNGHYNDLHTNMNYLSCYVPYGFNVVSNYNYHYQNIHILTSWMIFVPTYEDYIAMNDLIPTSKNVYDPPTQCFASNVNVTGYPKMDLYCEDGDIPEKINNGKPIIIYAPHWSVGSLGYFDDYSELILNYVKNNPDINFVFKPHPFLPGFISKLKDDKQFMTIDEYNNYIYTWDNLPNGIVITGGNYISLFKQSTCLITDSGSFIAEYLPSKKPCIYIMGKHSSMNNFNDLGKKILASYYVVNSWDDLSNTIRDIMNKVDPKKKQRLKNIDEVIVNMGSSGKIIVNAILRQLSN